MRANRLLTVLLLLQARRRVTGRQLAAHLEVSARTVHRDMDALSAAGVPVVALRGSRGGWELSPGWRTEVPGLDDAELGALLMAQPRVIGDGRLAAAAERALAKLLAALPAAQRDRAASMRQRLYVDPIGWRGAPETLTLLPVVQDAVARDRQLAMRYRSAGRDASDRVVSPLGLVAKAMTWYLVARADAGIRTYRVSRIERAEVLATPVERPVDFDLAAYWAASRRRFEQDRGRYEVTLRIDPESARWLQAYQDATVLPAGPDLARPDWIVLRVRFDREGEALFVARGLGPHAEVIEPASLRERVAADARRVAGIGAPPLPPARPSRGGGRPTTGARGGRVSSAG